MAASDRAHSVSAVEWKTQMYLAAGKPVLMGVRGDATHLVRAGGAGIVFAGGQAAALGRAVDTLLAMPDSARERMGMAGRAYVSALEAGIVGVFLPAAAGIQGQANHRPEIPHHADARDAAGNLVPDAEREFESKAEKLTCRKAEKLKSALKAESRKQKAEITQTKAEMLVRSEKTCVGEGESQRRTARFAAC